MVCLSLRYTSRRNVGVQAFASFKRVVAGVGVGLHTEDDAIETVVERIAVEVAYPVIALDKDDLLVVTSTLMAEDFFTAEIRENITSLSPLIVTMNQQFMTL